MLHDWFERKAFEFGLDHPWFFERMIRPEAYRRACGDPEGVHELALETLNRYEAVLREHAADFSFRNLRVDIAGKSVAPFGTAAGMDKNGDALLPLSHLFGFMESGTVVVKPREGNARPRVAVGEYGDLYNAQGFPSKGLDYFLENAKRYHGSGNDAAHLVSVCGLPLGPDALDTAAEELHELVTRVGSYADGFVWNPFSPNTDALKALRTPHEFRRNAEQIAKDAPNHLRLAKMGAYEDATAAEWLDLANAWMEGGGQGFVAVNTYPVKKEQVPSESWGYPAAGRSGRFLQPYRDRAIRMRERNSRRLF